VSAVWLCAPDAVYISTPLTTVLSDGYIARPLAIDRADDFVRQLKGELPDIAARLIARNSDIRLPEAARPKSPLSLQRCPGAPTSAAVLIRMARRASVEHRVACGLLFTFDGTLAMVLSEDTNLIDRYIADCEAVPANDYLDRYAS
jgi:hypothetical protein